MGFLSNKREVKPARRLKVEAKPLERTLAPWPYNLLYHSLLAELYTGRFIQLVHFIDFWADWP